MASSILPIIAVIGATGKQGSAVMNAIQEQMGDDVRIRAITRNPSSENAKKMVRTQPSHLLLFPHCRTSITPLPFSLVPLASARPLYTPTKKEKKQKNSSQNMVRRTLKS